MGACRAGAAWEKLEQVKTLGRKALNERRAVDGEADPLTKVADVGIARPGVVDAIGVGHCHGGVRGSGAEGHRTLCSVDPACSVTLLGRATAVPRSGCGGNHCLRLGGIEGVDGITTGRGDVAGGSDHAPDEVCAGVPVVTIDRGQVSTDVAEARGDSTRCACERGSLADFDDVVRACTLAGGCPEAKDEISICGGDLGVSAQ